MKRYSDYPHAGRLPAMLNDLAQKIEELEGTYCKDCKLVYRDNKDLAHICNRDLFDRLKELEKKQEFVMENGGTAKIVGWQDDATITKERSIGDLYEESNCEKDNLEDYGHVITKSDLEKAKEPAKRLKELDVDIHTCNADVEGMTCSCEDTKDSGFQATYDYPDHDRTSCDDYSRGNSFYS